MRLLVLDPHPVPGICPEALQILQTADALAEVGMQVTLVTPEPVGNPNPAAILGRPAASRLTLVHLPDLRRRWWAPKHSNQMFYWQAIAWLREHPVDAVLVRNLKLAKKLLKIDGLPPLFFETHEVFAQTYREAHLQPTWRERRKLAQLEQREEFVYRHTTGLIGLTRLLIDDIRSTYGITTPCMVAPDGVDLFLADQARQPRAENAVPVLLYLGSLHPWKGVDILIRAMQRVDGAELRIAGGGAERIQELGKLASTLGVAHKVRFLGEIPPLGRFDLINEVDVCLLPLNDTSIGSRYTSPLKLFEYMAMGKPIVISNLPAIREVLSHGESAILVEPENPAAFSAAILRLLEDPGRRQDLGLAASGLAQNYSWRGRADRISDFIAANIRLDDAPGQGMKRC